ncbi:hypothetical protein CCR75_001488 [Bremia lactucae]|uniref:Smr domain-containing protein n=1 Tax=Bremia lactucae TaxID=4779 RepID=A0A976IMA0_BRELC|nr:hypothetical protein CCR75_001488 [Bremia lactucae]
MTLRLCANGSLGLPPGLTLSPSTWRGELACTIMTTRPFSLRSPMNNFKGRSTRKQCGTRKCRNPEVSLTITLRIIPTVVSVPRAIFAMQTSETSTDTSSTSSLSSIPCDMIQSLSLSSDTTLDGDACSAVQIDLVLEMTATFDTDGYQLPSLVTRIEVQRALETCDGDVSRAVDEVLNLVAIKTYSQQDQQIQHERRQWQQEHAKLPLAELCSGLGLEQDSSFMKALQHLPENEQDELLATNGAFVQQLLLSLDEDSEVGSETDTEHPLQYLLELYPDYKADVVEDVLDCHGYDVDKAAEALYNLRALHHVQSFAAVVSADARDAAEKSFSCTTGPEEDTLEGFPKLSDASKMQQKKHKKLPRRRQKIQQAPHYRPPPKPLPKCVQYPALPTRGHTVKSTVKPTFNAWDHQHTSNRAESSIATQLKLERLEKMLPTIDRSVVQTTFFLNGCNSDTTEAVLREVYNLPLVERQIPSPVLREEAEIDYIPIKKKSQRSGDWTLVSSKHKVNASREALSKRYCDVLASFRHGQHIVAVDRIRDLSIARREHREAQRQWAHDYFLAHEGQVQHQQPIDLHGMIVMEALWVAREVIEYCQEHRIRRCILICGVGHHSINGKPRILTALQLSLQRRQIAFRELYGIVTVFPLRSISSS